MSDGRWLAIAAIVRPHALRGAVQLKPYTRTTEDFLKVPLSRVHLRDRGKVLQVLHLETRSIHKGLPLVTFREISDRTAAEGLKGMELVIAEEDLEESPDRVVLPVELEGFAVIDKEAGERIGTLLRIETGRAHDYIVFTHPEREGGEVMLPHVDAFVHRLDLTEKVVEVTLPEGLLEL